MKVPKSITHDARLRGAGKALEEFMIQVGGLGEKLGCLLVQLPPSLDFDARTAGSFFRLLRAKTEVPVACEPRHAGWFGRKAQELFLKYRIARVAADPAKIPEAAQPGGWPGLAYHRLHGSPKIYYSDYSPAYLDALADHLASVKEGTAVWCIFDNTTLGAATRNARTVLRSR